jgi:RimJ/RimL family protein N-acetyltransferase
MTSALTTLMPGSAPPPSLRRPAHGRYMSNDLEREYAAGAERLAALDQDIRHARRLARHPHPAHGAPPPAPHGTPAQLADGTPILIRPIEAGDAEALREGFRHLDAGSRYERFLTPIAYLTDRQLDFLTHVDHEMHEALVAIDAATGEGLGVARFLRDLRDPSRADVAIAVVDGWQGRGVGTLLATALCARARAVGVTSFTARMLAGNHAARQLVGRVGDAISEREDGGAVVLTATPR